MPTVVVDGDLDIANQITEHWGPDFRPELLEPRTPLGLVQNKYPIGLALTLLPAFLVGHLLALASGGLIPADGYSWPYQIACLAFIQFLVWRTFVRIDRLSVDRLGIAEGPTLLGIAVVAFGTPYAYYAVREPFMVHAVSTFWCTEVVAIVATAVRGPAWFWPRLAFCGAMALVCRPTNAHLAPVAILGIVEVVRSAGLQRTLLWLPTVCVGLVPIGVQLGAWRLSSGSWIHYSYGHEGFDWAHPALLETLFSSRHGLFFWSPILLVAIAGTMTVARDPLVRCWLIGAALLWYADSAWWCWWFGDAFGGRAFLELTGLFGTGLAAAFARLRARPWLTWSLAGFAVAFNLALMALYIAHAISRDGYLLR